jgi:ubiquinone/menaquinone biosynthesis C-methylase UbiE
VTDHGELIKEEFSRQASGFEDRDYSFGDQRVLNWIVEHVPVTGPETVLDVAGGTGQVARAYAELTRFATVLDLTRGMLETGKREADAAGVRNLVFQEGEVTALPFLEASFDLVISRFAVHHFPDPVLALAEMRRVCRGDGRVAVMDLVVAEPELADAYNLRERLRDPSHAVALGAEELRMALQEAGLEVFHWAERDQPIPLSRWLSQTEPPAEVAGQIEADLEAELAGGAATGMRPQRREGALYFTQRWTIAVGQPRMASNSRR